jgi:hypothetical protein
MAIQDLTVKLEIPQSESDSNYSEFEFMLAWYSRTGSYMNYLFTDWEERQNVSASPVNIETKEILTSIIRNEERPVTVVAEDLTLNDLKVLSSIFVAKKIIRVFKDGTTERIAVSGNGQTWRQTDGRYDLKIDVEQYERALPK